MPGGLGKGLRRSANEIEPPMVRSARLHGKGSPLYGLTRAQAMRVAAFVHEILAAKARLEIELADVRAARTA